MRLPHHFLSSPLTVLSTSQTNGQKYTHRDTQTQRSAELQLCSGGGGGGGMKGLGGRRVQPSLQPPPGQWRYGIWQSFIGGSGWQLSVLLLPRKAELLLTELHKGQALRATRGFYEPAYPLGASITIFMREHWSSQSHGVLMKGAWGGLLRSVNTSWGAEHGGGS